ncbi:hypothetical protein P4O66_001824 [Electrophorus voltai]|uniref:Uncharacterized protein n=1 Tax=Electrophorus voltai TaxID=2609070 RepID=A0AAD9DS67_9TELE|nr:hypothetical protein P4O66_001824 [Electrophorus voltai]
MPGMVLGVGHRAPERPSLILASLHGSTAGEGPVGFYGDQPVRYDRYSELESAGLSGDQPNYVDRYSEVESAGSCMDLKEGYAEYGERGESNDVALESDMGSDREENPSMKGEEVPQEDPPSQIDITGS